jgi:hypothetical protein
MVKVSTLASGARRLEHLAANVVVEYWLRKCSWRKQQRDFQHALCRKLMVWEDRVASLTPDEFTRTYRLSLSAFNFVLERIRPAITTKAPHKARRDINGAIPPELLLLMTLRYLAGGSYLDIYQMHGVGKSTMFHAVPHVCHAICHAFPLCFPIGDKAALVGTPLSLSHSTVVAQLPPPPVAGITLSAVCVRVCVFGLVWLCGDLCALAGCAPICHGAVAGGDRGWIQRG